MNNLSIIFICFLLTTIWSIEQSSYLGCFIGLLLFVSCHCFLKSSYLKFIYIFAGVLSIISINIAGVSLLERIMLTEICSVFTLSMTMYYTILYTRRRDEGLSFVLELGLLSYALHRLIAVNISFPARPYWLIDTCIEYSISPPNVYLTLGCLIIIVMTSRFVYLKQSKWPALTSIFMICLIVCMIPEKLIYDNQFDINEEENKPENNDKQESSQKDSHEQPKDQQTSVSSQSKSNKQKQPDQKHHNISLMRFYGIFAPSERLKSIFVADSKCKINESYSDLECKGFDVNYVPEKYGDIVHWERYDLSHINTHHWRLQGQNSVVQEMILNSDKIMRSFKGKTRLPFNDLIVPSNQVLRPVEYLKLLNADTTQNPENETANQFITNQLESTMKLQDGEDALVSIDGMHDPDHRSDTYKLKQVVHLMKAWKLTDENHGAYCNDRAGTKKQKLICAYVLLKYFGISSRIIKGYIIPHTSGVQLTELLINSRHEDIWIEVFVEDYGEVIGWRSLVLQDMSQSANDDLNNHEQMQLISHWIDQAQEAHKSVSTDIYQSLSRILIFISCMVGFILLLDRLLMIGIVSFGSPKQVYLYSLIQLSYLGLRRGYGEPRSQYLERCSYSLSVELNELYRHLTNLYESQQLTRGDLRKMRSYARAIAFHISIYCFKNKVLRFKIQSLWLSKIDRPTKHVQYS